ncbi:unnamed protein product [Trichobilharzia szidati]|nr:unnamed protein product [Trichobilharzia szidati]
MYNKYKHICSTPHTFSLPSIEYNLSRSKFMSLPPFFSRMEDIPPGPIVLLSLRFATALSISCVVKSMSLKHSSVLRGKSTTSSFSKVYSLAKCLLNSSHITSGFS